MKRPKVRDFHKDIGTNGMSLTFRPSRKIFKFEKMANAEEPGKTEHLLARSTKPKPTIAEDHYDERNISRMAKAIANTKE